MTFPVVRSSFREYELAGCPLLSVGGLECVALWRVAELLKVDRKVAAKMLAKMGQDTPPRDQGVAT